MTGAAQEEGRPWLDLAVVGPHRDALRFRPLPILPPLLDHALPRLLDRAKVEAYVRAEELVRLCTVRRGDVCALVRVMHA